MADLEGNGFRFIEVNADEDELVVHAGSAGAPAGAAAAVPEADVKTAVAGVQTGERGSSAVQGDSRERERLRERARELEESEAGLEDRQVFPGMRIAIIVVLALAAAAFAAYMVMAHG